MATHPLEADYQWCQALANSHYENFPVASFFLPFSLRRPIQVIYAFARSADDLSDEGSASNVERLAALDQYWQELEAIKQDLPSQLPLFRALKAVIQTHSLPIELFFDLLRAFKQDVIKTEYENIEEILDYCRCSANPIGRLILHLAHRATPQNCQDSDAICTSLQLINFLQDLDADLRERHRCYLPQDEMRQLNLTNEQFLSDPQHPKAQTLIHQQLIRAKNLLQLGKPLSRRIPGLLGFELRLIVNGGETILQALFKRKNLKDRPVLKASDWVKLFLSALFPLYRRKK